jgi:hypothetical protein
MENPNWENIYKPSANLQLQGNPALDDLRQQYAQRQAQKQQENADFTKEIAKLNFNGSRDSDHGQLQQGYADVVGTFAKLRNENDPKKRAEMGLELQQKQNQFMYNAENSKVKGQHEQELINLAHRPDVELQDGALDKIQELTKTPYGKEWEQKYQDLQSNLLAPKADLSKMASDTYKEIGPPKEKNTLAAVKDKVTGEYRTPTVETTKPVDKEAYSKGIVSKLVGNHAAQRAIMQEFPGSDIKEATQKYIDHTYPMFAQKAVSDTTYSAPTESFAQKKELARYGAEVRSQYSTTQQPTPFRIQTDLLGNLAKNNPAQAKQVLDEMVKLVPNHKGGINTNISPDGTVAIDFPRTKTHRAEQVRLDANSQLFPDLFAQKMRDHGVDISLYNQGEKGHRGDQQQPEGHKKITTPDEVNKLPKGTHFIWKDGQEYIKQ